jgi:hypothetical protein
MSSWGSLGVEELDDAPAFEGLIIDVTVGALEERVESEGVTEGVFTLVTKGRGQGKFCTMIGG